MPCRNALRSTPLLVENGNLVGKLSMSDGLGCLTRSGGRPSTPAVRIASTSRRVMFRSNAALLTGAAINQKQESFLKSAHQHTGKIQNTTHTPRPQGGATNRNQNPRGVCFTAMASHKYRLFLRLLHLAAQLSAALRRDPARAFPALATSTCLLWSSLLCAVECCAHWAAAGPGAILPLVGPRVRVLPAVCGSRFEWECVHTGRGVVSHVVRQGGCAYICHI